jgi:GDPmannose 4,6-dehydratase
MKTLICGISGQDGAYLARLLLEKGYTVIGASRDAEAAPFSNLEKLGILDQVEVTSMALNDFRSVIQVLKSSNPDEIYNLSGQSSVGLSFNQPVETLESIVTGTLNLLEGIRFLERPIKFYNAGSSECFGDIGDRAATESTLFQPRSPYAVAKAAAYWEVANYREAYDLFACTGILFNHESQLRPERYVTRKIISGAVRIADGKQKKLQLGNIDITRDWGWAPEYVEAMWKILQHNEPDDFVIATGESNSLQDFIEHTFKSLNLNWQDHVETNPQLFRPTDLTISKANPRKANDELGWKAQYKMRDIIEMMIEAESKQTPL